MMENNYIIPAQNIKYKYVKTCFFFTHQLLYLITAAVIKSKEMGLENVFHNQLRILIFEAIDGRNF